MKYDHFKMKYIIIIIIYKINLKFIFFFLTDFYLFLLNSKKKIEFFFLNLLKLSINLNCLFLELDYKNYQNFDTDLFVK
jgi:hypothetical protein